MLKGNVSVQVLPLPEKYPNSVINHAKGLAKLRKKIGLPFFSSFVHSPPFAWLFLCRL